MRLQTLGLVAAAATFGSVWFGHVAVRFLEHRLTRLWPARLGFGLGGAALLAVSLAATGPALSAAAGIAGLVLLYDIVELSRQERRVREGRALANPANPRHRPVFEAGKALTEDLFEADPEPPAYRERGRKA